jgi:hypothetical protein
LSCVMRRPFYTATQTLSGSRYPTLHLVKPTLKLILRKFEQLLSPNTADGLLTSHGTAACKLLATRTKEALASCHLLCDVATALHPLTKNLDGFSDDEKASIHANVLKEAKRMGVFTRPFTAHAIAGGGEKAAVSEFDMLGAAMDLDTPAADSAAPASAAAAAAAAAGAAALGAQPGALVLVAVTDEAVHTQLAGWTSAKLEPPPTEDGNGNKIPLVKRHALGLSLWRKCEGTFPLLAALAKRTLLIPATAAGVEGVWSRAGYLVDKRRTRFLPSTVRDYMFLNSNRELLNSPAKPPPGQGSVVS